MKKIGMAGIVLGLILALAPDIRAQLYPSYAGDFSVSVKSTCEEYDKSGNIKLITEPFSGSGQIYFYPDQNLEGCYIKFVTLVEGPVTICITDMALANTGSVKSKSEKFQLVGYGKYLDNQGESFATIEGKGKVNEDSLGNIIKISSISGKLSGGTPWSGNVNGIDDCTWTANFSADLFPE